MLLNQGGSTEGQVPTAFFGSLIIVVAAFIEPPLILVGGRLASSLRNNRRLGLWLDRGLGTIFVALGLRLATSSQ